MRTSRRRRTRSVIVPAVGLPILALLVAGWALRRPTTAGPTARAAAPEQGVATIAAPAPASRRPEPDVGAIAPRPAGPPPVATSGKATMLLAGAARARQQGDLRTTLALLRDAVERAPSVETHAALGALYLELGAAGSAEANLRAAAEGDPGNADRWVALANALSLKPDPIAAAHALERAHVADPGLRVARDAGGALTREPAQATP